MITRFPKPYPRVADAYDATRMGNLIAQGPEQSEVHWDNGSEDISVINKWLKHVTDVGIPGVVTKKVSFRPDDDLSERLKGYSIAELKAYAVKNGVWQDKYDKLPNPGLMRMAVANRLRKRTP